PFTDYCFSGGQLCNKCGLFERTHSRPRPQQFPQKREPVAATTPTIPLPALPPGPPSAHTYPQ
ncbi:hypothetical protein B0H16DRAFT_1880990, partial [Mycena metata]